MSKRPLLNVSDSDDDDAFRPLQKKPSNGGGIVNFSGNGTRQASFPCSVCKTSFTKKSNLQRHQKTCQRNTDKKKFRCNETDCFLVFYRAADLNKHLDKEHNKKIKEVTITFSDYENFLNWKEQEQIKTCSYFAKQNITGDENEKYERFVCQHHGSEKKNRNSQKFGKRMNVKKEGQCSASFKVVTTSQAVTVRYTSNHTHN